MHQKLLLQNNCCFEIIPGEMEIPFNPSRIEESLTSHHRELVFLTPATTPATLLHALSEHLPHIAPQAWPALIARGGVYLNGICSTTDRPLPSPCRIEFFEPKGEDLPEISAFTERIKDFIVYEDDELLIVYKPQGISSMPTREQRELNLKGFLEKYLRETAPEASLHMPSRVDTSVEGLVVTSKAARMHAPLQRVFEKRRVQKTYLLETRAAVSWETLSADRAIARDARHPILRKAVATGGRPAHTEFKVLQRIQESESGPERVIAEARPVTGRTHQIRVHASSYEFPITGDNFYNGAPSDRLHLVSYQTEFVHPHRHVALKIVAPERLLPKWLTSAKL